MCGFMRQSSPMSRSRSRYESLRDATPRFVALAAIGLLVHACGGGGGSGSTAAIDEIPAQPPEPITLVDSVPASGGSVSASISEFNIAHLGASDWQYRYTGDCAPTGVAVRRGLSDLSNETTYPEVVDHHLDCTLESGRNYELRADTTAGDGTRHRASLAFRAGTTDPSQGVRTLATQERSEGAIGRLYERYVRNAALKEFDAAVLGAVGAAIVAQLARANWDELSRGRTRFGSYSERVSYPSRKADGSAAMLSGLIVRPRIIDEANFVRPGRVVVLSHSTGSHPSNLDIEDAWFMLGNLLAGRGYLVLAPDNWGNGETAGEDTPETYMMASRVANTSLDMIHAVREDERFQTFFDPAQTADLAVIGYSQGGHSGMALWLAHALEARDTKIREVYIGAGPYDLHRMLQGGLLRLANRCENNAWCEIDVQALHYYVERWVTPGYFRYLETGLTSEDVLVDEGFASSFVTGYLDLEDKFDTFKVLLQLNSFTNLMDLIGTVESTDTLFHLFHAKEDSVVPRQSSIDLSNTLMPAFNVALHSGECNGNLFNQLSRLETGAVHSVCALEMFNRVLKDLHPVDASGASSPWQDAGAPWQALAEQRALQAIQEQFDLKDLKGRWSAEDIESMAANLEAMRSPAAGELAERLRMGATK